MIEVHDKSEILEELEIADSSPVARLDTLEHVTHLQASHGILDVRLLPSVYALELLIFVCFVRLHSLTKSAWLPCRASITTGISKTLVYHCRHLQGPQVRRRQL